MLAIARGGEARRVDARLLQEPHDGERARDRQVPVRRIAAAERHVVGVPLDADDLALDAAQHLGDRAQRVLAGPPERRGARREQDLVLHLDGHLAPELGELHAAGVDLAAERARHLLVLGALLLELRLRRLELGLRAGQLVDLGLERALRARQLVELCLERARVLALLLELALALRERGLELIPARSELVGLCGLVSELALRDAGGREPDECDDENGAHGDTSGEGKGPHCTAREGRAKEGDLRPCALAFTRAATSGRRSATEAVSASLRRAHRQRDGERRAATGRVRGDDVAAVHPRDLARDVEPEPEPGDGARPREARERREQAFPLRRRDPRPVVRHRDACEPRLAPDAHLDRRAGRRELDRVLQELRHHLCGASGVCQRQGGRAVGEVEPVLRKARAEILHHVRDQRAQVDARRRQPHVAALETGDVDQLVQDRGQALHGPEELLDRRGRSRSLSRSPSGSRRRPPRWRHTRARATAPHRAPPRSFAGSASLP